MRLLFYVEHFRRAGSGAENDAVSLCVELARRGHDVHVSADTADAFDGITVHPELAAIPATLCAVAPDVTVDWGFFHAADLHRLGGGVHREFLRYSLNAYPPWLRRIKQLGYRQGKHRATVRRQAEMLRNPCALFLCISEFVARQARVSGAVPDAVHVLHNAVDTCRFDPERIEPRRQTVRRAWGVVETDVVFLFVAHNLRLKNLALLRRVFDRLQPERPGIRLVVVGKRRPRFTAPYLVYAGATDAMESFYAAADVLLHPSFFDSFANVVLEAMSCGLPAAVSDCSGVSELLQHGTNGFVLPVTGAGDVTQAWADLVRRLSASPEERRAVGDRARTTAAGHDFRRYVTEFEAWLERARRR
ncbi:MAG: hypothetical protein A3K19_05485 [Lentisphaerae bacterium RIFOXYB12_FULL_65_16]|nr:MAG: hypothetical protein A3K18_15735 [Lentisphaerae bacterium RIFOXYA12_64_32]OGV94344.1 MAG: hypothetical protein A3K19_05485 [Lentisphaerae bacterium RIFOXYB12_FULL_65_16]